MPLTLVEGAIDDARERADALAALGELSLLNWDPLPDETPAITVHHIRKTIHIRGRTYCPGAPTS
jgi:hypothetical protein